MSAGDPGDPDTLVNPSGVAYPTTVQRFVRDHLVDHTGYAPPGELGELRDALEAAIAADREHRPAPELDQVHLDRLVQLYVSGQGSGAATILMQTGVTMEAARAIAQALVARLYMDPAMTLDIEQLATRCWTNPPDKPEWHPFTSYAEPRNHRDD